MRQSSSRACFAALLATAALCLASAVRPAAATCTVGGMYTEDAGTLLLLHLDNSYEGAEGEAPMTTAGRFRAGRLGNGFAGGAAGRGSYPDWLVYDLSGNIDPGRGMIELWFRPDWDGDDLAIHNLLTAYTTAASNVGSFYITKDGANNLIARAWPESGPVPALIANVGSWRAGEWHHVAVAWDGADASLYIDAVERATVTTFEMPSTLAYLSLSGHPRDAAGWGPAGTLDELRISDAPRCIDRLATVFSAAGPAGGEVLAVLAESAPDSLIVAASGYGVASSDDGGSSWTDRGIGLASPNHLGAMDLAQGGPSGTTLYVATFEGVIATEDGAVWSATGLSGGTTSAVVADPFDPSTLWAGTQWGACYESALGGLLCDDGGVLVSTDAGATWTNASTGLPDRVLQDLAHDAFDPDRLFAVLADGRVYTSGDGGAFWTEASGCSGAATVVAHPAIPGTAFVGTFEGVAMLDGTGSSCGAVTPIPGGAAALLVDGTSLWAGTFGGELFVSTDDGLTFDPTASGPGLGSVRALARGATDDPASPDGTVLYAVGGGGVARSLDGGAAWLAATGDLWATQVWALDWDPVADALYAGTWRSGVFFSGDRGLTWQPFSDGLPPLEVWALEAGPAPPDGAQTTVYAGLNGGSVWRYDQGLSSWVPANAGLFGSQVWDLIFDPEVPGLIYAATQDQGVFRSFDYGVTWERPSLGPPEPGNGTALGLLPGAAGSPSVLFVGTPFDGIFRSDDAGATWTAVSGDIPDSFITSLAGDPNHPTTLYAGTFGGGVFRSDDGGATWNTGGAGFDGGAVRELAVDPTTGYVYAATRFWGDVMLSKDGGDSWASAGPGLKNPSLASMAVIPGDPALVLVGSEGAGVYAGAVPFGSDPPTAAFVFDPPESQEGSPVCFDASASGGGEAIVDYAWDMNGDGEFDDESGVSPCHVFADDGLLEVALRVTDAIGATATATAAVSVLNVAPTAAFFGGGVVNEGGTLVFDPSPTWDPGADQLTYEWDLDGDGSFEVLDDTGAPQTQMFPQDGIVTITLRVSDDDGGVSEAAQEVTVLNVAPVVFISAPDTAEEGTAVTFEVAVSDAGSDPIVAFSWDLDGDGDYEISETTGAPQTMLYPDDGVVQIGVRAIDDGGAVGTAVHELTVLDVPPVALATVTTASPTRGVPVHLDASASYAGAADVLTYAWDLGDGSAGPGVAIRHVYAVAGSRTVTLTVRDDDGNQDTASLTLSLAEPEPGIIATIAGGLPNNVDGLELSLLPANVATGIAGEWFVSDTHGDVVYRIDTTGRASVVAGTGVRGYNGDGIPAGEAMLSAPYGLAVDDRGNLFIADCDNRRVRRVDAATGIISTVAGTGVLGFNGDGIPAVEATLRSPMDVAIGPSRGLVIADYADHRIRYVDAASGVITTIAGTGIFGYNGDELPAETAQLAYPTGVAIDADGTLFIADSSNHRVRLVDAQNHVISTAVGTGVAGYNGEGILANEARLRNPRDVAIDATGALVVADYANQRIRRVDPSTLIISTIAGTGSYGYNGDGIAAVDAKLYNPFGVAVDAQGNLLVADLLNHRVRQIDVGTGLIATVAGSGSLVRGFNADSIQATTATLAMPDGIAVDDAGNMFIADYVNHRIRRVDGVTGVITTVAGTGEPGYNGDEIPAVTAQLSNPTDVAIDGDGNLLVADYVNRRIRQIDSVTGVITTFAGGASPGDLSDGIPVEEARLARPTSVTVDLTGNVYIAEPEMNRVRRVDVVTGIIETVAGTGAGGFNGDEILATTAWLNMPIAVEVGPAGNIFIADVANCRIRRVDMASGIITTVAGNGVRGYNGDGISATSARLATPAGVALDSTGNIFIADKDNSRVRRVDAMTDTISTVAGTGVAGYNGDGGPASITHLWSPSNVATDANGNLYIADSSNDRIRIVPAPVPGPAVQLVVSPEALLEGGDLLLDAGGSTPAGAPIVMYSFDVLGDGRLAVSSPSSSRVVTWTELEAAGVTPGRYLAVVTALDADGRQGAAAVEWLLVDSTMETPPSVGGEPVTVAPVDPATGESPVEVTFSDVTAGGYTTLEASSGAPPVLEPDQGGGFALGAEAILNITTTAEFSGPVTICMSYADTVDETGLELAHLVESGSLMADGSTCEGAGGCWEIVTSPGFPDVDANVICGEVRSLSPFALVTALEIQAPADPVPVDTPVGASLEMPSSVVAASALWLWGDGTSTPAVWDEAAGRFVGEHAFVEPGVYTIALDLIREGMTIGRAEHRFAVVYDPSAGFVTGGGWIESPVGAYPADPTLTGRATFGFVSRYKKGASVPTGQTQFEFKAGGMRLRSDSYQWLVVAGAKAKFKGEGQVNGESGFSFMISAVDADLTPSTDVDLLRVKIWQTGDEAIVYDNQLGEGEDADPSTALAGGSIVVHK